MEQKQFIDRVWPSAQKNMQKSNILASLTIAQAILESGWGKSGLARQGNALFGIKVTPSWRGRIYTAETTEYYSGKARKIQASFRAYNSWEESIEDHLKLLTSLKRYRKIIGEKDYKKACVGIQQAGYATDPTYSQKLIQIIEKYKLYEYDQERHASMAKALNIKIEVDSKIETVEGYFANETNYVPIRFLERFNLKIDWDGIRKIVKIRR